MRLQFDVLAVDRVAFGPRGDLNDGVLTVEREELITLLASDPRFQSVEVEVTNPGEPCRVVNVFDVAEPRVKVEGGPNFPGVLEPIAQLREAGGGLFAQHDARLLNRPRQFSVRPNDANLNHRRFLRIHLVIIGGCHGPSRTTAQYCHSKRAVEVLPIHA